MKAPPRRAPSQAPTRKPAGPRGPGQAPPSGGSLSRAANGRADSTNGAHRNGANGHTNGAHSANGAHRNGANGHANGANGKPNGFHGGRPVREVVLSGPQRRSRLGAPRTVPAGDERILSFDEASAAGPEIQRLYRWAPRCRTCGQAMRGIVEVTAPAEGPNRHAFTMNVSAVMCPSCRTDNFLGAFTSWLVVSGPLPVQNGKA